MSRKLVCGVGVSEAGDFARTYRTTSGSKKNTREYELWRGLLRRCYAEEYLNDWPSYKGCTTSSEFNNFQYFARWCQNQIGFQLPNRHLDKDLVGDGKTYSENSCVFLPALINTMLTNSKKARGKYPVGVHWCNTKNVFVAQCQVGNGQQDFIGYFSNPKDAFLEYKNFKEARIKRLADQFRNEIDPRAYEALMAYKITMED